MAENIFGQNLIKLRTAGGFEADEVSQKLNINLEHYKKLEFGIDEPKMEDIQAVSDFFNIDGSFLFIKNGVDNYIISKEFHTKEPSKLIENGGKIKKGKVESTPLSKALVLFSIPLAIVSIIFIALIWIPLGGANEAITSFYILIVGNGGWPLMYIPLVCMALSIIAVIVLLFYNSDITREICKYFCLVTASIMLVYWVWLLQVTTDIFADAAQQGYLGVPCLYVGVVLMLIYTILAIFVYVLLVLDEKDAKINPKLVDTVVDMRKLNKSKKKVERKQNSINQKNQP